ncbi:MAG: hypothetical protein CHACPFDD_02661 [Phycisphaerae bacterium]|nr:hypothetical protein [Phycisphaerae bacterium]
MALELELKFYEEKREELLKNHEGKYVLIKGSKLIDAFDTAAAAFEAGVAQFGSQPILIKRVVRDESVDRAPVLICGWCNAQT